MSDETLQLILNKLTDIEQKLDILTEKINKCETSCKTMDDHIVFIEETYGTIRSPLDYLRSKFNYMTGTSSEPLPLLKNKDS